jgi:DNA-binding NarL/FixJ family response regulator
LLSQPTTDSEPAPTRKLRILVIDDHEVVQWGFRLLFAQLPWVERCIGARSGSQALALCARYEPHVALLDLFLQGESGPEICARLRTQAPAPRVILMSGAGSISARAARAAGAAAFISKERSAREIVNAVQIVGEGGDIFEEEGPSTEVLLSAREREVLAHIARGQTNREIAAALYLSPHTVKEHTSTIYRKLGARNRAEAVKRSQELGMAPVATLRS